MFKIFREKYYFQTLSYLASIWISLGKVAENMRVCLLPGGGMLSCSTMRRIWGSNPMSSIRSASSRQRYRQNSSEILPAVKKLKLEMPKINRTSCIT